MSVTLVDPHVEATAAAFWDRAGGRVNDSVDFVRTVALTLPLDVVVLSRLTARRVEDWLAQRGVAFQLDEVDRSLYGLLTVYRGTGFVFLDGSDDRPTRRFTLAHEVAHFLLHYLEPRQLAIRRLGHNAVDVLDGLRAASRDEELAAVITGVEFAPHVHLLARTEDAADWQMRIGQVEVQADELALELLAPAHDVVAKLRKAGVASHYFRCAAAAESILIDDYDLPAAIVGAYARRLARAISGGPSLLTVFRSP